MKRFVILTSFIIMIFCVASVASANSIDSSTMWFEGYLTDDGGGKYLGILNMVNEETAGIGDNVKGFDVYAKDGATAWFGDAGTGWTSLTISSHDAWPTWTPDTPDWYQYSLDLYKDGGEYKWALRNHAGSTEDNPHSTIACGVPMSGSVDWAQLFAAETDVGAYLPGTGTSEIPGGAASYGGGAGYWDMDWSWGSEVVPLEYSNFKIDITDLTGGKYIVSMTPIPDPSAIFLLGSASLIGLAGFRRKFKK